ncbi:MAG: hypothetical protein F4X99_09800 [Gammaproteobacteria bacterium]|nr:hypothetical protein [Gammaproteobacteria bacterium]
MSGLFRYAVVLACVRVCAVDAAEIDPETEVGIVADLAEYHTPETAPHRRTPLPPALLPMLRPLVPGDLAPEPHPAAETLRIGRCDAVDPPLRL